MLYSSSQKTQLFYFIQLIQYTLLNRNDAIVDVEGGEEDGAGGGVGDNVIVEIEEEDTDDATQQLQSGIHKFFLLSYRML